MALCFSNHRWFIGFVFSLGLWGCAAANVNEGGSTTNHPNDPSGNGSTGNGLPPGTISLSDAGFLTPGAVTYAPPAQKLFPENYTCKGEPGMWGEALQKALWFLNVNKAGTGITSGYVQWRGDAHIADAHIPLKAVTGNNLLGTNLSQSFIDRYRNVLDPVGNQEVDLGGGYHDAGDYIKFGLTTGFMASTLAWSLYEFPESYRITGLETEAIKLLKWADDYFMRSTFLDATGNLVAFAHQVGDGTDHTCGWMPPELRRIDFCPRKAYFTSDELPAADVTASASAALALTAILLKDQDATYAQKALKYAQALYAFAAKYPNTVGNTTDGLYTSEYAADDLAWAAIWLHMATGTESYLEDILRDNGWLSLFPGFRMGCLVYNTICWSESHTHCWNSLRSGVFLKLAQILRDRGDTRAIGITKVARGDSIKWTDGTVTTSPGGFSVSYAYGSARYNSAAQFVALTYAKVFGDEDPQGKAAILTWAKRQIAYILGDNPLKKSYMMGFSNKYALQPHHAAGHASVYGEPDLPADNRHVIWGALVNGPDASDKHIDKRGDYGSNEVTIDYNVSLIAALAAHYGLQGQGQCPLRGFPPTEPAIDEYYTLSNINATSPCRSQINITLINETIHPPRYNTHLSFKYFFDISELQAQGKSIADVKASLIYDRGATEFGEPTSISEPKLCPLSSSTYYVEMGLEGYKHWGRIVKLKAPRTVMLDIGVDYGPSCIWDPANDWSYEGLVKGNVNDAPRTPHIAVYSEGLLAWGQEPPCFEKKETQPPPVWIP